MTMMSTKSFNETSNQICVRAAADPELMYMKHLYKTFVSLFLRY